MITEWSLLTEQMIGSIGWKSTSFTMLRWPGRRYLRLTPFASRPLDRQRGSVIHVHEPVATPAARHRQVGAPRAPQQVPAGSLLRLTRPRHAHRVSAHQLHAAALALEERVDVPHAQSRVQ